MNPNKKWINNMLNDPSNQMNSTQMSGSSSQSGYLPSFHNPYMNPDELALFSQWKLQQQFTQFTQHQPTPSQPNSDYASFHLVDEDDEEEDEEEEIEPTPTSSKKSRTKTMARKRKTKSKTKKSGKEKEETEPSRARIFWTQDEEYLLEECFIQVSEDPKVGADQKQDTFWYKVLDAYNKEATRLNYATRTKNMLTGKWTPMNRDVKKWNAVVDETTVMSGEIDIDFMTRCHILFKKTTGCELNTWVLGSFWKTSTSGKTPTRLWQDVIVFGTLTRSPSILGLLI